MEYYYPNANTHTCQYKHASPELCTTKCRRLPKFCYRDIRDDVRDERANAKTEKRTPPKNETPILQSSPKHVAFAEPISSSEKYVKQYVRRVSIENLLDEMAKLRQEIKEECSASETRIEESLNRHDSEALNNKIGESGTNFFHSIDMDLDDSLEKIIRVNQQKLEQRLQQVGQRVGTDFQQKVEQIDVVQLKKQAAPRINIQETRPPIELKSNKTEHRQRGESGSNHPHGFEMDLDNSLEKLMSVNQQKLDQKLQEVGQRVDTAFQQKLEQIRVDLLKKQASMRINTRETRTESPKPTISVAPFEPKVPQPSKDVTPKTREQELDEKLNKFMRNVESEMGIKAPPPDKPISKKNEKKSESEGENKKN